MKSFLLVDGFTGNTYTSVDGATWLTGNTPTLLGTILSVASGGNGFHIIHNDGTNEWAYTSYDGLSWDVTLMPLQPTIGDPTLTWSNLIWDGVRYVAWNEQAVSTATSIDGKTWTTTTQASLPTSIYGVSKLIWNGTKYVVTGIRPDTFGTLHNKALTSTDAVTWSITAFPSTTLWGDNFIAAAAVDDSGKICVAPSLREAGKSRVSAVSTDGVTWTTGTVPTPAIAPFYPGFMDMAWNGSVFCAVGGTGGATVIATSTDGLAWTQRYSAGSGTPEWNHIAWNGSVFLIVDVDTSGFGTRTLGATSPDGITWTRVTLPSTRLISASGIPNFLTAGNLGTPPVVGGFWKDLVGTREFIY